MKTISFLLLTVFCLTTLLFFNNATFAQNSPQWHLPDGAIARLGKGSTGDIAYFPDGSRFAMASSLGIWIYDAYTHAELALFTGIGVDAIALSPDGNTIASANDDDTVGLWDVATGQQKFILRGHRGYLQCIAFSPDGLTIASGSEDYDVSECEVRLWDVATGQQKAVFIYGVDPPRFELDQITSVTFSPDSRLIATGHDGPAAVIRDAITGERKHTLDPDPRRGGGYVWDIAYSPDGNTLAGSTGFREGTMALWDVTTGERKAIFGGNTGLVWDIAYSPDGRTIVSASDSVRLWDATTGQEQATFIGYTGGVNKVSFSPDGRTIISSNSDNTVRLWDVGTSTPLNTLTGYTSSVYSVAFSPDGTTLASGSWDDTVRLWDVGTSTPLNTLTGHTHSVRSVAFSPDGRTLASGSWDNTVRLWDATTGVHLNTLTGHIDWVDSVAFSPDGSTIASGSWDDTVRLWDATTGAHLNTLTGHTGEVGNVAFSPDGSTIASGSWDDTVRLWDATTGAHLNTLIGHTDRVYSVAFSPDGSTIASGSWDDTVRLWDATTGAHLNTLIGHTDRVYSVAFSPDGRRLASASGVEDRSVRQWDAVSGQLLNTFIGHASYVRSVSYSPNGSTLASGSWDGTVLLWQLTPTTIPITFTPDSVPDQTFTVGTPVSLTLPSATGGTAPYTYTLSPIPAGLQFDTATQLLSGTPTTEGTTTLTYTATDATGASAALNFTINVSMTPLFWMYWVSDGGIRRAINDGTNLQTLVASGGCFSRYIALDVGNGKLYWTDNSANKIQRANLDGSNVEDVIIGLNHPTDLALDVTARKMYWIDWERSTIQRANLDGSNVEVLVTHVFNPRGIALDVASGKMYWTTGGLGKIQRANLDGTNVEDLVTTRLDHPTAITVDVAGGKMYWAMNTITVGDDDGVIQRANLDGSNVEDLVSGLDSTPGLALDIAGGKMYWTDISIYPHVIWRANLDGSNVEDVITPIRRPCDLALGISVSPPTPPLISFTPPTIADQTFTVGTSVSLTLPIATGGTPPYAYSIAPPPPAGLVFNTATRLLSGTPTTVMQQTRFTYTAADATGAAASLTFNIEVTGAGRNPLDVNGNGQVNVIDLVLVAAAYGEQGAGLPADVNADGVVNIQDLIAVAAAIDASGAALPQAVEAALLIAAAEVENIEAIGEAPRRFSTSAQPFSTDVVYSNVADALADVRALGTGDVQFEKWLPLLEELLQVLTEMKTIPETTALLPNYPNPFNPETWIPYQLSTSAEVTLSIYSIEGRLVRTLDVGHQLAGVYQSRGRAASWDGRNNYGEHVASGLYFYTLTAGDFTATRRLLIAK